jgi:hypothetical protein
MVVQTDFCVSLLEEAPSTDLFSTSQLALDTAGDDARTWANEISKNVVTPTYILRRLAASSDTELKMAVADHINTPLQVLLVLAEDGDPDVRFALAENHNIGADVLNKLSDDSNPYVAQRAHKTLSRLRLDDPLRVNWYSRRSA